MCMPLHDALKIVCKSPTCPEVLYNLSILQAILCEHSNALAYSYDSSYDAYFQKEVA